MEMQSNIIDKITGNIDETSIPGALKGEVQKMELYDRIRVVKIAAINEDNNASSSRKDLFFDIMEKTPKMPEKITASGV